MTRDSFQGAADAVWAPSRLGQAVTPSDVDDLPRPCKGLWISAAGTVSVLFMDDPGNTPVALGSLDVGTLVPVRVKRVRASGTSATVIALY